MFQDSYMQDDYEFEDDNFDEDDERENDPQSDEDTEEASETDMGRHEEPLEIKEQMYQDKLNSLKKQLQQLKDGSHQEYNRKVKKLEYQYKDRLRLNSVHRDYLIECVERDFILEEKAAEKDFEEKKIDLRENLLSDFEDKKKSIEAERYIMELTGDSMDVKPVMTRKLRRRPNDPPPVPEKRRKPPTNQLVYQLEEKEVENDLKIINRGKVSTPIRKPPVMQSSSNVPVSPNMNETLVETRVEDGKLLYERRWFHRGQTVYVESRDTAKFAAEISAISNEFILVKKMDGSKVKIYISHLSRGKVSIKRRAS